jgi:dihydrofolate reductase
MKAILACDYYGGIGKSGHLPWTSLNSDMERFVSLTQGCTVVMGHKTWKSLPKKPLPNRKNIVVSQQLHSLDNATVINNISELEHLPDAWFIGGAELLQQVWPFITEFHLTRANAAYSCDTYINLVHLEQSFTKAHQYTFSDNSYEIWLKK